MANQQYRSQFGDTTLTKVFVGGLAWETPTDKMRRYFDQFGQILEAVIITDKASGKSKGYGFVTFRDPDSARRACADPNPVIDGRRANCNIASFGLPRPSPPRGRNQGGNQYHEGGSQQPANSYSRILAPPPPSPSPLLYPPYGFPTYSTPQYGYHHNPQIPMQYYHQMYGTSSSTGVAPYHYAHAAGLGYPFQASGASFAVPQAHRIQLPPYRHYPAREEEEEEEEEEDVATTPTQQHNLPMPAQIRQPAPLPASDSHPPQEPSTTTGATSQAARRS